MGLVFHGSAPYHTFVGFSLDSCYIKITGCLHAKRSFCRDFHWTMGISCSFVGILAGAVTLQNKISELLTSGTL